jgi:hypothetical protein
MCYQDCGKDEFSKVFYMERPRLIGRVLFPVLVLCGYGLWGGVERFGVMQPAIAQSQVQGISWGQIFDFLKRKRVRGGSRNPFFCAASPALWDEALSRTDASKDAVIWNVRPLFVWKGKASHVEVRQENDSYDLVWESAVTEGAQQIRYSGKALKTGQVYAWKVFVRKAKVSSSANVFIPVGSSVAFQVMGDAEHQRVARELDELGTKLKGQNGSVESLALHRANYFARRELWADVLLEAFSVKRRSSELTQLVESVPKRVCHGEL